MVGSDSTDPFSKCEQTGLKTAILISSCPKNMPLAQWTAGVIDRWWDDHPPVFFSGCEVGGDSSRLELRSDRRDWMAVTRDAVEDLKSLGFSHAYLILDDHPPVGKCNVRVLNTDLPALAQRLDAAYVGLLGYGQHRESVGVRLGARDLFLEKVPRNYRWRFSLHPALWSLEALEALLVLRMDQYATGDHTPWNFERHRDELDVPSQLSDQLRENVFRINGAAFDADDRRIWRGLVQSLRQVFFDGALFFVRIVKGRAVREQTSARWLWAYSYYRGPYPLFWGGVMMQGKLSPHLENFLRLGCPAHVREVLETARQFFLK